ncbi:MAG: potassium-transporting ATPase subunit C [Brockia lithotrophica]|nr:potassium-transporting ATPase subunit C [Brockia lithotrophica]
MKFRFTWVAPFDVLEDAPHVSFCFAQRSEVRPHVRHRPHPSLIAQPYAGDGWFHPRPPAGEAYDPLHSGGTNLAVARPDYQAEVLRRMDAVRKEAGDPALPVPADLVTASGSGLDPDLSLPAARAQVPRISRATGIPEAELLALIDRVALPRELGLFGEPRVNVNVLNEALRALLAGRR